MSVRCDRQGEIATLTLIDDSGGGVRLYPDDLRSLTRHLDDLSDPATAPSVLLLRSEADDFCLGRGSATPGPPSPSDVDSIIDLVGGTNRLLERFPGATIAAVRGRAFGAGLSLAARCDIVIASGTARLSFPEVAHDIPPTIVMSYFRFDLSRKVVSDLVLTGREVSGVEGLSLGLVSRVCPETEVEGQALATAQLLSGFDRSTVMAIKTFLVETEGMSRIAATDYGNALMRAEFFSRALR